MNNNMEPVAQPLGEAEDLLPAVVTTDEAQEFLGTLMNFVNGLADCQEEGCVEHNRLSGTFENYAGHGGVMISHYEGTFAVQTAKLINGGYSTRVGILSSDEDAIDDASDENFYDHPEGVDRIEAEQRHNVIVSFVREMDSLARELEDTLESRLYGSEE